MPAKLQIVEKCNLWKKLASAVLVYEQKRFAGFLNKSDCTLYNMRLLIWLQSLVALDVTFLTTKVAPVITRMLVNHLVPAKMPFIYKIYKQF